MTEAHTTSRPGNDDRVAQASRMLSVQVGSDLTAAITLMQHLATDTDCTVEEIATMVIEREIEFDSNDFTGRGSPRTPRPTRPAS